MKRKLCASIFVLALLLASCATFTKTSYVTLSDSQTFYDLGMKATADFQAKGLIDQVKRDEINRVAKIYKEAHNLAVEALKVYEVSKTAADKDKFIVAFGEAASKWAQVAKLINAIKPGSVPATLSK